MIAMSTLPLAGTCLLIAGVLNGADWPEWRGPHRDGVITGEPSSVNP
jgi:hypothetical protein